MTLAAACRDHQFCCYRSLPYLDPSLGSRGFGAGWMTAQRTTWAAVPHWPCEDFTDGQRVDAQLQDWRALLCEVHSGRSLTDTEISRIKEVSSLCHSSECGVKTQSLPWHTFPTFVWLSERSARLRALIHTPHDFPNTQAFKSREGRCVIGHIDDRIPMQFQDNPSGGHSVPQCTHRHTYEVRLGSTTPLRNPQIPRGVLFWQSA